VQIAGGLVGQDYFRFRNQRARYRDKLLLSAGPECILILISA
jgi:hypothetical protein